MKRAALASAFLLAPVFAGPADASSFSMKRAINIAQWLTWPRYDAHDGINWPPYKLTPKPPSLDELQALKQAGFDAIRLPVDPAPFFLFEGERREQVYAILFDAVARIETAGLKVVLDLHPNSRHPVWGQDAVVAGLDAPAFLKLTGVVGEMARRLRDRAGSVALELLNEPRLTCKGADQALWQQMIERLVSVAHAQNPELTLVVTGACVSSPEGLLALNPAPFTGPNIIYTFHFYEPFSFTHQGAQFIPWPDKYLDGVPWPAGARPLEDVAARLETQVNQMSALSHPERLLAMTRAKHNLHKYYTSGADAMMIIRRFAQVADWARKHGIAGSRIFVGEFGVVRREPGKPGAFCEDRARWHRDVVSAANTFGFSWAYFSYDGPFGLTRDEANRQLDSVILGSLGLCCSCVGAGSASGGQDCSPDGTAARELCR